MKVFDGESKSLNILYQSMLFLRLFEEKIIEFYPEQEMKTPVHLGIGQEAVAAGCLNGLRDSDVVYSNHRGHLHYLAKGGDPYRLVAELYGSIDGCAKGRGGSMHLVDTSKGLPGSTAIVSGGVPIAVGAALGFRMQNTDNIAIVFLGDGAMDEGVVTESFAFAALKGLPVVFVVENNGYATASGVGKRQLHDNIYKRGEAFGIKGVKVDGNDVVEVQDAAFEIIKRARDNQPGLLECVTYRWKGHVGINEDTGYRTKEEIEAWKKRCPLKVMEEKYDIQPDKNRINEMKQNIDMLFIKAKAAEKPDVVDLLKYTYIEEV